MCTAKLSFWGYNFVMGCFMTKTGLWDNRMTIYVIVSISNSHILITVKAFIFLFSKHYTVPFVYG